jgi:hypothetical protein
MFAYCLAAAHLQLPHQTALSFMISDAGAGKMEGWSYIDKMPDNEICGGFQPEEVPNVLHFCQRYGQGNYFFGKLHFDSIASLTVQIVCAMKLRSSFC